MKLVDFGPPKTTNPAGQPILRFTLRPPQFLLELFVTEVSGDVTLRRPKGNTE